MTLCDGVRGPASVRRARVRVSLEPVALTPARARRPLKDGQFPVPQPSPCRSSAREQVSPDNRQPRRGGPRPTCSLTGFASASAPLAATPAVCPAPRTRARNSLPAGGRSPVAGPSSGSPRGGGAWLEAVGAGVRGPPSARQEGEPPRRCSSALGARALVPHDAPGESALDSGEVVFLTRMATPESAARTMNRRSHRRFRRTRASRSLTGLCPPPPGIGCSCDCFQDFPSHSYRSLGTGE